MNDTIPARYGFAVPKVNSASTAAAVDWRKSSVAAARPICPQSSRFTHATFEPLLIVVFDGPVSNVYPSSNSPEPVGVITGLLTSVLLVPAFVLAMSGARAPLYSWIPSDVYGAAALNVAVTVQGPATVLGK